MSTSAPHWACISVSRMGMPPFQQLRVEHEAKSSARGMARRYFITGTLAWSVELSRGTTHRFRALLDLRKPRDGRGCRAFDFEPAVLTGGDPRRPFHGNKIPEKDREQDHD